MSEALAILLLAIDIKKEKVLKEVADYFERSFDPPMESKSARQRLKTVNSLFKRVKTLSTDYNEFNHKGKRLTNFEAGFGHLHEYQEFSDDVMDEFLESEYVGEFQDAMILNKVETFSGDPLEYSKFMRNFESEVGSKTHLNEVKKFSKLKERLTGDALKAIKPYSSNHGYYDALEELKEKYGTKEIIGNEIMTRLTAPFYKKDNMKEVWKVFQEFEYLVSCLRDIGEPTDGFYLEWILRKKLPDFIVQEIDRIKTKCFGDKVFTLTDMRKELRIIIPIYESYGDGSCENEDKPDPKKDSKKISVLSGKKPRTLKKFLRCSFCDGTHYAVECSKYPTMDERRKLAKEYYLCYNCLKPGHPAVDCTFKPYCKKCKESHQAVWCEDNGRIESTVINLNEENLEVKKRDLMMTAKVKIVNPKNPRLSKEVLAVIASASRVNLIDEDFAAELGLPSRKNPVNIKAMFDSPMKSDVEYEFHIQLHNKSVIKMDAHGMEEVLFPIDVPLERNEILRNPSGFSKEPVKIGKKQPMLLLGTGTYIKHVARKKPRDLGNGFIVQYSSFGPIVWGKGKVFTADEDEIPIVIGLLRTVELTDDTDN
ncbi:hypothetical protein FO519_003805 [Halicephalobus sp. NKZ332]|nr:hypothetical protein FO519_003805 [Halicephalobus sp. NKZ332]